MCVEPRSAFHLLQFNSLQVFRAQGIIDKVNFDVEFIGKSVPSYFSFVLSSITDEESD